MKSKVLNFRFLLHVLYFVLVGGVISCTDIVDVNISSHTVNLLTPPDSLIFMQTTIGFKWNEVADADSYTLQIVSPSFAHPIQWITDTTLKLTGASLSLPAGEYEWRVKASNFSFSTAFSSRSFSIIKSSDITQEVVFLQSPIDHDTSNLKTFDFKWRAVIGADHYHFRLLYQQQQVFQTETEFVTIQINPDFGDGLYTWQVKGENDQYSTVYFSRTFLSDTTPPGVRTLVTPRPASVFSDTIIAFSWQRSGIVLSKETDSILLYTDSLMTHRYIASVSTVTSKMLNVPVGTYFWTVKGSDRAGNNGEASPQQKFKVVSGSKPSGRDVL